MSHRFTYLLPAVVPPPISFDIPDDVEFVEIRAPKKGDWVAYWCADDNSWAFWPCPFNPQTDYVHVENASHPVYGKKTFIFKKLFTPKIGDLVLVKDNGTTMWEKRIYLGKSNMGYACLCYIEDIKDIAVTNAIYHWDNCKAI